MRRGARPGAPPERCSLRAENWLTLRRVASLPRDGGASIPVFLYVDKMRA